MSTTILSLNPNRKPSVLATLLSFFLPALTLVDAAQVENNQDQFARARRAMIERDLVSRGIRDRRVLEAMGSIERELFVPEKLSSRAYEDRPLPIGEGQTISQPYMVAFMTELLNLTGTERLLEIGTGSGYQTAVLGKLAAAVYSIEIVPKLSQRLDAVVRELRVVSRHPRPADA